MQTDQLHGFIAPAGLGDNFVALFFEGLFEVEANNRFVFSNNDTGGHRCAPVWFQWDGRSDSGGDEPVKQVVLRHFQLVHLSQQLIAMATHCLCVTLSLVAFLLGEGRLRDQRPKAGLVSIVGKVGKLLFCNAKITIDRLQAVRNVTKTPFDEGAAHGSSLGPDLPVPWPPR